MAIASTAPAPTLLAIPVAIPVDVRLALGAPFALPLLGWALAFAGARGARAPALILAALAAGAAILSRATLMAGATVLTRRTGVGRGTCGAVAGSTFCGRGC